MVELLQKHIREKRSFSIGFAFPKYARHPPVDKKGAQAGGQQVSHMPPQVPQSQGDLGKDGLLGGKKAVNVKHIGVAVRINGELHHRIDAGGDEAAGKVQRQAPGKARLAKVGEAAAGTVDAEKNQQKVPEESMKSECPVGIEEAFGEGQGHKASKKPEILEKGGQNTGGGCGF